MAEPRAVGHPTLSDEEVADRWGDLKRAGVRRADAATQLGMTHTDLTRTLERVRNHARTAELKNAGTQPEPLTRDELVREWDEVLRPSGYSFVEAAERLGLHPVTFENHIRSARDSGDERAKPPAARFGAVYGPVHDNNRGTVVNPVGEWGGKWAQADAQARERVELLVGGEDRDTAGYLRAVREGTVTGGTAKTGRKAEPVANQDQQAGHGIEYGTTEHPNAPWFTDTQLAEMGISVVSDSDRREEQLRWEPTDIHAPADTDADEAVAG